MSGIDLKERGPHEKGVSGSSIYTPMQLKTKLSVDVGFATQPGPNESNDDSVGVRVPDEPELTTKGVVAVIADGVSVAEAGKQAAEISVKGFLNDYFDAPEAWTVETAGKKVVTALNRWLHGLGQGYSSSGQGYVCTFSGIVFKAATAYLFHVGDSRIYRLREGELELLTRDHSVNLGVKGLGLARALGMDSKAEIDFRMVQLRKDDLFVLSTDGIHGFLDTKAIENHLAGVGEDLDQASEALVELALKEGSNDNCSAALVRVMSAGTASSDEMYRHFRKLPFPPDLYPGMSIDGYEVVSELQATSRSQTYVAVEKGTGKKLVLKTPSVNFEDDIGYIERFIMEGWIGTKLKSDRLPASIKPVGGQSFLYTLLEYVEGPTLQDWMKDKQTPDVRKVVDLVKEILQGLRVMHRQDMLHQDLKPGNVIVHPEKGAVIIDFGSTHVPGIQEIPTPFEREQALGTLDYSAPEYFLKRKPSKKSDVFSVGVILYEMLTGKLPYGAKYEKCQTLKDFTNLEYIPAMRYNSLVPVWLDGAIKKCVSVSPNSRYETMSEFEYDLDHPNPKFSSSAHMPWIEKNPVLFWKIATGILAASQVVTLWWVLGR